MDGLVYQINNGQGGVPKLKVGSATFTQERVMEDDWNDKKRHGGKEQAVCLFSLENLGALNRFNLFPGALGENITTSGIEYKDVRVGDIFQVGSEVLIQITKPRRPCATIERAYGPGLITTLWDTRLKQNDYAHEKWGLSGFYARVLQEGGVAQNDRINLISRLHT